MNAPAPAPASRPPSLILASGGTAATGATFAGVGIASMLVGHGLFSAGVGAMLVIYGVVVGGIGWAAWRRHLWTLGAMVASALLHLAVALSTAWGSASWPVGLAALVPLAVLVGALAPSTRSALSE
ncbi:MAG TPA: hypothetical protein PKN27_03635 [Propionibacteriaceae bacterium]|nr:hypothetical protein [Propionibacteriaceae bacterium]